MDNIPVIHEADIIHISHRSWGVPYFIGAALDSFPKIYALASDMRDPDPRHQAAIQKSLVEMVKENLGRGQWENWVNVAADSLKSNGLFVGDSKKLIKQLLETAEGAPVKIDPAVQNGPVMDWFEELPMAKQTNNFILIAEAIVKRFGPAIAEQNDPEKFRVFHALECLVDCVRPTDQPGAKLFAAVRAKLTEFPPLSEVEEQHIGDFKKALLEVPSAIRNAAINANIKVVIGREKDSSFFNAEALRSVVDGNACDPAAYSSGEYIYLRPDSITTHVIAEELVHSLSRIKGGGFCFQPPWQQACDKDLALPLSANALKWAERYHNQVHKGNSCFRKRTYGFYEEALPDMAYLDQMAGEDEREDLAATFPNMWKLYKGPREGNVLVQAADHTIQEIAKDEVLADCEVITSFMEHCRASANTYRKGPDVYRR